MSPRKPITIVGGGLAGLALGIGLRQRDVPATIWEAGHYPRHRVCGEFISGHGQAVLVPWGKVGSRCQEASGPTTSASSDPPGADSTTNIPVPLPGPRDSTRWDELTGKDFEMLH